MTDSNTPNASRHDLLLAAPALMAGAAAASAATAQTASPPAAAPRPGLGGGPQGQIFWTVDTTAGKVQGIANTGIKEFKGVPYGAPTGGKNRFMPPKKPDPGRGSANASPTARSARRPSPTCAASTG
jgi:para-nitrobenzyl esterase